VTTKTAIALVYAGARIAYGVALVAEPRRTARSWLGDGLTHGAARVGARALGARDALMSAGVLDALRRGHDPRPWLVALAAADVADIGASLADRRELPERAGPATALVAGTFSLCGLGLAAAYS
jgi:hypothetical protein